MLRLYITGPEQLIYELIHPVVLFGRSPAERARETGVSQRAIHRNAGRFDAAGMIRLLEADRTSSPRALPEPIRRAGLELVVNG